MADEAVRAAYASRAAEYVELIGSLHQMHDQDRRRIGRWAAAVGAGPLLDAGCGPGHWTAFLHESGASVRGMDLVPEFLQSARARFPGVTFQTGSLRRLDAADHALAGILAWYSLIHLPPPELPEVLAEFARALRPGGGLLLGFFDGPAGEPFPHKVATAYFWSVEAMTALLEAAGFDVCEVERRQETGHRPHAALSATTAGSPRAPR